MDEVGDAFLAQALVASVVNKATQLRAVGGHMVTTDRCWSATSDEGRLAAHLRAYAMDDLLANDGQFPA